MRPRTFTRSMTFDPSFGRIARTPTLDSAMTSQSYREDAAHYPRIDRKLLRDLEKMELNATFRPYAAPVARLWSAEDAEPVAAEAIQRFKEMSDRLMSVEILSDVGQFRIEPTPSVTLAVQQVGRSLRSPEWHKRQRMYNLRRRVALMLAAAGGIAMGAALFYGLTA